MAMVIKKKNAPETAAKAPVTQPAPAAEAAPTKPISKLKIGTNPKPGGVIASGGTAAKTAEQAVAEAYGGDAAGDADDAALNNITGPGDETPQVEAIQGEATHGVSGTAYTSKQYKDGTSEDTNETLPVVQVAGEPAIVRVDIGLTRNLGNYESIKVSVGISIPCAATAEDIDATYHEAKGWCDARIEAINEEITQDLNG